MHPRAPPPRRPRPGPGARLLSRRGPRAGALPLPSPGLSGGGGAPRVPWLALAALAFWPVWIWWFRRLLDPSDPPWGLAPLLLALVLSRGSRGDAPGTPGWAAALPALAYAVAYPWLLPLPRAALAVLCLGGLLAARRGRGPRLSLLGLLGLSLPVLASLQFFLGYPLRAGVAAGAAGLLSPLGMDVQRRGALLLLGETTIAVDPPCSGVKMLWSALVLAFALAHSRGLSAGRTLALAAAAVAGVLTANVLRASSLVFVEGGLLPVEAPGWAHDGVGLASFALVVVTVVAAAALLERGGGAPEPVPTHGSRAARVMLGLALGLAALRPLLSGAPAPPPSPPPLELPATFEGRALRALPPTPEEARFYRSFPGALARGTDGERSLLFRRVDAPTRRLHPAVDCYRGIGYRVEALPPARGPDGSRWSAARAVGPHEAVRIREQIRDADGQVYLDPSSWYWAALSGHSRGPWTVVTVARAEERGT